MSCGNIRRRLRNVGIAGCGVLLVVCAQFAAAQEMWLVTPEEAALAPAPEESLIQSRGLSDTGPLIDVLKPTEDGLQPSTLEILVRFVPRAAAVDLASLKVTLLKFISIDITDRVRSYVTAEGIHLQDAKIPAGKHQVRISLRDTKGGISTKDVSFEVR